jgi:hypothetical protein
MGDFDKRYSSWGGTNNVLIKKEQSPKQPQDQPQKSGEDKLWDAMMQTQDGMWDAMMQTQDGEWKAMMQTQDGVWNSMMNSQNQNTVGESIEALYNQQSSKDFTYQSKPYVDAESWNKLDLQDCSEMKGYDIMYCNISNNAEQLRVKPIIADPRYDMYGRRIRRVTLNEIEAEFGPPLKSIFEKVNNDISFSVDLITVGTDIYELIKLICNKFDSYADNYILISAKKNEKLYASVSSEIQLLSKKSLVNSAKVTKIGNRVGWFAIVHQCVVAIWKAIIWMKLREELNDFTPYKPTEKDVDDAFDDMMGSVVTAVLSLAAQVGGAPGKIVGAFVAIFDMFIMIYTDGETDFGHIFWAGLKIWKGWIVELVEDLENTKYNVYPADNLPCWEVVGPSAGM